MKKIILVIFVLTFVLSSIIGVYAIPVDSKSSIKDFIIADAIATGFDVGELNTKSNSLSYETSYEVNGRVIVGTASVIEKDTETVVISEEPGKKSILVFKDNGDVYLNGILIQVETFDISDNDMYANDSRGNIGLYAQRYNRWQSTCPYGTPSQYTTQYDTIAKNISFQQAIANQTVYAIILAIKTEMFPLDATSPTDAQLQDWLGDHILWYIGYCEQQNPGGNALSMITYRNIHSEGMYIVSRDENIFRVHIEFYTQINFGGMCRGTSYMYNLIRS